LGTWELNVAASKFSPGPAPKSQTLKYLAVEGGIKLKSHAVDADGKAKNGEYVSNFDGKDVPWKGNPDADTCNAKRLDDDSYENTWKKDGAVTITQVGKNAAGAAVDNTLVFDRK
jgi:hypothetical protein